MTTPHSNNSRPLIRFATLADMDEIARIYAPYVATPITFDEGEVTPADFRQRFDATRRQFPWLVIEQGEGGHLLGYAYAHPQHEREAYQWNAETSIYLDADACGRGLGGILYDALLEILRLQGYTTAYALVTLPNAASEKLHDSRGFSHMGTQRTAGFTCGAWRDVAWLVKPLNECTPHPTPPVALDEYILCHQDQVAQLIAHANERIR